MIYHLMLIHHFILLTYFNIRKDNMKNNKVKHTAKAIFGIYNELCNGDVVDNHSENLMNCVDNIVSIAVHNSRGWKELAIKLKEYLDDVNKYIKDQLRGLDVSFPGVFNVVVEADDEDDNSIISLELGSGTNTIITKINCKEEC